jgi:predicted oxidoreductase
MGVSQIEMTKGGPLFSRIVAGMWRLAEWDLSPDQLLNWIDTVLDLGITTFDHADIYGDYQCEELFGRALAPSPALRERIQLVTKCGIKLVSERRPANKLKSYDTSQAHIIASVENSLRMLATDYIDLLLIHRPDPLMDADEVAEAFAELQRAGKVLYFGASNFAPRQYELLSSRLQQPLVTNQIELSVLYTDLFLDGTVDQCQARRAAPMAWSPFGGGRLFTGTSAQALRVRQVVSDIGREVGEATLDQVALAWLLKHPARIVPVLGTGNLDRVRSAVQAEHVQITRQQWFDIWSASTGEEVP